jgi:predicted amidophosphoribosyltransferase
MTCSNCKKEVATIGYLCQNCEQERREQVARTLAHIASLPKKQQPDRDY